MMASASRPGYCSASSNATTNSSPAAASTRRPAPRCIMAMLYSAAASPARSPTSRKIGNACSK